MRAMKAFGALAALLAVVIGPPVALAVFIGNPWPAEGFSLSAPLTDSALIGLLAVIVWVLWAQLVGCIVVEAVAALSGDRIQLPSGFALGIQQQLARRLVTAVVVAVVPAGAVLGGGGGAAQAAAPVSAPATGPVVVSGVQGDVDAGVSAEQDSAGAAKVTAHSQTVPVVRLDSLWGIADRVLGDGDRWPEIAALNEGRTMNDGALFTSADQIRPGWELRVPADANLGGPKAGEGKAGVVEHQVVVQPGDTLSEIALEELGDAQAYPSIVEASAATEQPGGVHLVDPDVIDVGWTVTIPGAAAVPQDDQSTDSRGDAGEGETLPKAGAPSELEEGPDAKSGDVPPTMEAAPLEELPQVQEDPEAVEPEVAPPAVPETPAPSAQQQSPAEDDHAQVPAAVSGQNDVDESDSGWPVRTGSGIGVLLAAGFIGLLARRRSRQRRGRKPGERMPLPAPAAEAVEVEVRAVANEITLDQVDVALRHLAEHAPAGAVPVLRIARLTGDQLEVYLDEPVDFPAPWTGSADGAVWMLPADALAELEVHADGAAPFPALVTVGTDTEGGVLLVNLEHCGGLQAAGAPAIAQHLVTATAVELAVSPWAAGVAITVIRGLDELVDVVDQDRPGGMRYVPLLEDVQGITGTDRVDDAEDFRAQVVVDATGTGTTSTQRQALREAGVAVVSPGVDEPGAWTLETYDSDRAMLVDLGLNVSPQLVDEPTYDGLIEILRTSLAQPVRPARRDDATGEGTGEGTGDVTPPTADVVDEDRDPGQPGTYPSGAAHEYVESPRPPADLSFHGAVAVAVDDRVATSTDDREPEAVDAEVLAAMDQQLAGEDLVAAEVLAPEEDLQLEADGDVPPVQVDQTELEVLEDEQADDLVDVDDVVQVEIAEELEGGTSPRVAEVLETDERVEPAVAAAVPEVAVVAVVAGWQPEYADDELHPLLQTGHPVVRLLCSTVDIVGAAGTAPKSKSHRDQCKAIATWLVLNPDRSRSELVDAVWGTGRRVSANTVDPRISNLRNWLGMNAETEQKYFPPRTLRLEAPVTSDWHIFTQLVGPSPEKASSTALESALGLVRDTPFKGESSQQYGFAEYVLTDMVDTIADAAYELARRRYMDSSWRKAERAARVGVIVDPSNERLWRIRIHAAHAAGKPEEVEEFIDRMHARISELGFDLEPETTNLIEAVRRHDTASVAAQAQEAL